MNSIAAFLTKIPPFNGLPAEQIERLSLLCQIVQHGKGEVLYNEGENAAHVWILQSGRLEILKYNTEGRPLAIETIQPNQMFGTLCRLGAVAATTYPCTAVAAANSVSIRIPDRYFNDLYNRFPPMVSSACRLCSLRLGSLQQRTITYQEPVRTRIVRTLLQLQESNGNVLPFTKREISELAATTVETTIRILSALQKKRLLGSSRGKIILKDSQRLRSLLEANISPTLNLQSVPINA